MASDYQLEDTLYLPFTTRAFATGIPTALAGTPVVTGHRDANLTQFTTGITLTVSLDTIAGLNMITVVATAANGYVAGETYTLYLSAGTVGGVSVVGEVVAHFTLDMSAAAKDLANATDGLGAIKAETAAIVLDTAEIGAAGAGLTNINLPDQTMDITGNLSGTVGSVTGAVGSVTGAVGSVTGAVGSVTGHTNQTGDSFAKFAGITALAEWLGLIAGKQAGDATALTEIKATGAGSGTYDPTTDSTEALRDHVGDGTNLTEAGATGDHLTAINLPNQTMDITGNLSGSVGSVTGAVGSVTGAVGSVTGAVGSVTGAVGSVTGHTNQTGDSFARLGAPVGASISADIAAVQTAVNTIDDLIDTEIGDIQARLPAALSANGNMKSDVLEINSTTAAASALAKSSDTIVEGTVSDVAASTTVFDTSTPTTAIDDFYNGRIIIFTSGTLQNQATDITDYTTTGGLGTFTVTALTSAPADGVTFVIV